MMKREIKDVEDINLDTFSEGIQILREYTFYNNLNFLFICKQLDPMDKGSLPRKEFVLALKDSPLYFTQQNIEDIFREGPKNQRGELNYRELFFIIKKGKPPKTRLSFKNLYNTKRLENFLNNEIEEEINIKDNQEAFQTIKNFFDKKRKFVFKNYDLPKLELSLLRSHEFRQKEEGDRKKLLESKGDQDFEDEEQVALEKEKEVFKSRMSEFHRINNEIILENYQSSVAKELSQRFMGKEYRALDDNLLENAFYGYLSIPLKNIHNTIFLDDFSLLIQKFKINLTNDELELLYNLIWKQTEYTSFNHKLVTTWINLYRNKKFKELIKIDFQERDRFEEKEPAPKIIRDLIKVVHRFGFHFMKVSISPYLIENEKLEFESFQQYLKSVGINYQAAHFTELQFYLANNKISILDNYRDVQKSKLYLNANKLLENLKDQMRNLNLQTKEEIIYEDSIQACESAKKVIQESNNAKIEKKLVVYADDSLLINELKLREIIGNDFPQIEQHALDLIFDSMKNNIPPSKYLAQRKIFIPEFMEKLGAQDKSIVKGDKSPAPLKKSISDQNKPDLESEKYKEPKPSDFFAIRREISRRKEKENKWQSGFTDSCIKYANTADIRFQDSIDLFIDLLEGDLAVLGRRINQKEGNVTIFLKRFMTEKDIRKEGNLTIEKFEQVLTENYSSLSARDINVIISMADDVAGLNVKEPYNQIVRKIDISYLCLQLEKMYLFSKMANNPSAKTLIE